MTVVHDTPLTVAEILGNQSVLHNTSAPVFFQQAHKLISNKAMGLGFRPCMALACFHQQF